MSSEDFPPGPARRNVERVGVGWVEHGSPGYGTLFEPVQNRGDSPMKPTDPITRRQALAVGAAAAATTIVPRHVLGGPGNLPPSERVNLAGIGAGGMGGGDIATHAQIGANIVALCDVDDDARRRLLQGISRRPGATRISASCSTRKRSTSTPSPSARPTTSTPWPRWPRSAPASTSTARSR